MWSPGFFVVFHTLLFFKRICFRNLESYEIPPDVKIGDIHLCGNIHEKFDNESLVAEEVIRCF